MNVLRRITGRKDSPSTKPSCMMPIMNTRDGTRKASPPRRPWIS